MRRVLAFVLLLLGALATVLAATSVWADRSLLDESGWERRATAIADDPAVATAISDAILERVTVRVPASAERRLRVAVATSLKEPDVQVAWARLNRAAAAALLAAARGEPNDNVNANGDVVLDPEPLLESLAARNPALAQVLAEHEAREIVLVKASELDPLKKATDASDLAPPVLVALAVILLGLGAIAAPLGRRSAGRHLRLPAGRLRRRAGRVPGRPRPGAGVEQVAAGRHDHHLDVRHGPAAARHRGRWRLPDRARPGGRGLGPARPCPRRVTPSAAL